MLRSAISAVLGAALVVGCSSESTVKSQSSALSTVEIDSAAMRVWKPSSRRIEIATFGYWMGSSGYAKDRTELSVEQLSALSKLRTTAPPTTELHDLTSYRVRVLDDDGSVAEYRAAVDNVRDSDEGSYAAVLPTIDIATLQPFLSTFDCLSGRAAEGGQRETDDPLDPSTADLEGVARLPKDPGCINGVYLPSTCGDALFVFDVRTPATFDVVGGRCLETLSLRLYADDRTTLLAESTPGTDDSCFTLRHTFDVGSYLFVLSKTNAAGCASDGMGGDTSLRIQPVK